MVEVGAKEKVLSWIINRLLASSNRRLDIADLQRRHGATAEKITRLEVTDLHRVWQFRVRGGRLEMVTDAAQADGGLRTDSDALLAIALGRRRMTDPAHPERVWSVPYTPLTALQMGDLEVWGDAASNDALLFARAVYREVYPQLRADLQPEPSAAAPDPGVRP